MNVSSRSLVSVRLRKSPLIAPNNGAAGGADFLQFASVYYTTIIHQKSGLSILFCKFSQKSSKATQKPLLSPGSNFPTRVAAIALNRCTTIKT